MLPVHSLFSCELDHQLSPLNGEIITLKRVFILKERECHNVTIAANTTSTAASNEEENKKPFVIDEKKKKLS